MSAQGSAIAARDSAIAELESLPHWSPSDEAFFQDMKKQEAEFRDRVKVGGMRFLAGAVVSTILTTALWALTATVDRVALPHIILGGLAMTPSLLFAGIGVYTIASHSLHPIKDIFHSIGNGIVITIIISGIAILVLSLI